MSNRKINFVGNSSRIVTTVTQENIKMKIWRFAQVCPIGTYSGVGASECSPCAVGTFNKNEGVDSCLECPAGKFASEVGQTDCDDCDGGFYTDETSDKSVCSRCPEGETSISGSSV
eukprot:UN11827